MKKISSVIFGFLIITNLYAQEQMKNIDKLDALDQQSKEFFNAITGLEKNYLEEQVKQIKEKEKMGIQNPNTNPLGQTKEAVNVTQEEYEKNVFKHQNEIARLTTDFTRTKKLKDLKIKSMYSFNGKDYVVLELVEEGGKQQTTKATELSANIEGRYLEGDNILGHKIIDINTRTKSIELYKKLDEEYGYTIYLSNYGISVSDLAKIEKITEKTEKVEKPEKKAEFNSKDKIKDVFNNVSTKEATPSKAETIQSTCMYEVKLSNLNVRNEANGDAKILRILRSNDRFSIKQKNDNWILIDTIYKKKSGDVMNVSNDSNWVLITDNNVVAVDNSCN